jgi:hypothetical protein
VDFLSKNFKGTIIDSFSREINEIQTKIREKIPIKENKKSEKNKEKCSVDLLCKVASSRVPGILTKLVWGKARAVVLFKALQGSGSPRKPEAPTPGVLALLFSSLKLSNLKIH